MGYKFDFEWGESWIVEETDFIWDREYWYKVIARHIMFFREKTENESLITVCAIDHDGDYIGLVSVSSNYVHVIGHENELKRSEQVCCWMVDEI